MGQWYWYELLAPGEVRLLRVFGKTSDVILPRRIAAGIVTEIGAYCFAERERVEIYRICSETEEFEQVCFWGKKDGQGDASENEKVHQMEEPFSRWCDREGFLPLAGKNVTSIVLPSSITKIGNFAFYQCRELQEISLGAEEIELGSDAFMNCRKLSRFLFRGNPEKSSCLKQVLAQRSEETSVYFEEQGQIQAALLYPEYSENYDLIGPAHIFELNIQGEGFRARQCFQNGIVDFGAYDRIFALECGEESVETLCRMACNRLQYPFRLQERERDLYESYVSENINVVGKALVSERNLSGIQSFYQLGLLQAPQLQNCLEQAVAGNWTEGVREMLSLRDSNQKKEGTAYAFEDF